MEGNGGMVRVAKVGTNMADDFDAIRSRMDALGLDRFKITEQQQSASISEDRMLLMMLHITIRERRSIDLWDLRSISRQLEGEITKERFKKHLQALPASEWDKARQELALMKKSYHEGKRTWPLT